MAYLIIHLFFYNICFRDYLSC